MKFKNPIIPGFHPDPSICRVKDTYYLVNSSFDYFPGIPLFKSLDLVNWEQVGHVLTRKEQLPLDRVRSMPVSQGVYAPTIRYYEEKFYVIVTNISTLETFYVWTEDPESEWSNSIIIKDLRGFDPSLFFDEDGSVYLTAAAFPIPGMSKEGIIQARIDIETGKLLEEPKHIWSGSGYSNPEGPHLYKKDGWYYLMAAEGGTEFGHMETIARSRAPYGPYENNPNNPIVSNRSTQLPIQATGHADLIETAKGEWAVVLLGIRPLKAHKIHHLGRETNLAPLKWDESGWPIIGTNGRIEEEFEIFGEGFQKARKSWSDNFNQPELNVRWNTLRNLDANKWEIGNGLTLIADHVTMNETVKTPVFIGCRQEDKECTVEVELKYNPKNTEEEAGITVFMNEAFHYDFFITRIDGSSYVVLRKQVGDITHTENKIKIENTFVTLSVTAKDENYYFEVKENSEKQFVGTGEARLLAKEVAGGFTGIYFGMYTVGNYGSSTPKAYFKSFRYEII